MHERTAKQQVTRLSALEFGLQRMLSPVSEGLWKSSGMDWFCDVNSNRISVRRSPAKDQ